MGKRLIMILAFVLAVGLTCSAYAEVQNVRVSGDINAWYMVRNLNLTNTGDDNAFASIARVRVDADLTDNIAATVRLLNERYWGNETELAPTNSGNATDVAIDLAFVTVKEFLYSPLTVTVGRQDLRFGNAMIVGDPDTNNQATSASAFGGATRDPDLSARKAFDAIRASLDYDPLKVDVIYSEVREGTLTSNDDTTLYGINANYALDDKTTVEGYYFGRYTGRNNTVNDKPDRVDVIGARVVTLPIDNLTFQLEGAYQMGKRVNNTATTTIIPRNNVTRNAWAIETGAEYMFKDVKYIPSLAAGYAYFSGQKEDDSKKYTAWDPMYEDQKYGDIANALFDQSNVHVAVLSGSMKATEDVTLMASGYGFWWDKKFGEYATTTDRRGSSLIMRHNKYAATELDLKAVYDYTEDVQFSLLGGMLFPGNSFDKTNDATASEVIGSMKVIF